MAPHSSTLAWKIPWTEEPGRLQSMWSLGVGHDWATSLSLFTFMHWRRTWQPTPVFLPGESQGRGAWWAAVYGSNRVRHNWSDLAVAVKYPHLSACMNHVWINMTCWFTQSKNWEDVQAQIGDSHKQGRRKKSFDTTKKVQRFGLHLIILKLICPELSSLLNSFFFVHTTRLVGS